MKTLVLLLGVFAFAHANDLDKLSTDVDALSYVLNLKCLQAQFYSWASQGKGLDVGLLGWKGDGTHNDKTQTQTKVLTSEDGHDKNVDYGKYNDILGFNKSDHSQDKSDYGHDYNHDDYGLAYKYNSCQEYKDCPLLCKDEDCKDQCQQKSCYYYHCDNYKTCWDACKDDKECQGHCSYKGCDYGLYDTLQELIDASTKLQNHIDETGKEVIGDALHGLDKYAQQKQQEDDKHQKKTDETLNKIAKSVADDIQQQKQYLDKYVGGQKAQLSWYVQNVAEQLSWAEAEHVKLLRSILGDKAPECPKLDISVEVWETVLHLVLGDSKDKDGKWGLGYDAIFNPYNDDVSFMAAVFLFEDLGVTASAGVLDLLKDDAEKQLQLVKILAVESYQAGLCRSWLYQNGAYPVQWYSKMQVIDLVQKISNMRWKYGGQKDEGVCIPKVESGFWIPKYSSPDYKIAIAPSDEEALIWDRKATEVASILFGGDWQKPGLFYPEGFKLSVDA